MRKFVTLKDLKKPKGLTYLQILRSRFDSGWTQEFDNISGISSQLRGRTDVVERPKTAIFDDLEVVVNDNVPEGKMLFVSPRGHGKTLMVQNMMELYNRGLIDAESLLRDVDGNLFKNGRKIGIAHKELQPSPNT
ncbi:hypothetical protein ACFL4H_00115 [Candidatus Neomarinimicrobiota bacterium]